MAALGMACCQHDYRVRFLTAAEPVTLLVEAQQQGRLAHQPLAGYETAARPAGSAHYCWARRSWPPP